VPGQVLLQQGRVPVLGRVPERGPELVLVQVLPEPEQGQVLRQELAESAQPLQCSYSLQGRKPTKLPALLS
jgi:hypothetical protein